MSVAADGNASPDRATGTDGRPGDTAVQKLAPNQQFIWLGQHLAPEIPLYEMPYLFTIHGAVDAAVFAAAFRQLVLETPVLRQVAPDRGSPAVRIRHDCPAECRLLDPATATDSEAALRKIITETLDSRLQTKTCLYDCLLAKVAEDRYVWLLKIHHSVSDAFNGHVLLSALSDIYSSLLRGGEAPSRRPKFAAEQQDGQSTRPPAGNTAQAWWSERSERHRYRFYGGMTEAGKLHYRHRRAVVSLSDNDNLALRTMIQRAPFRQLTPSLSYFNIFATVLAAFLHRIEDTPDLMVGVTSHNRPTKSHRQTIGLFMRLLPFRMHIEPDDTFETLSARLAVEATGFLKHAVSGETDTHIQGGLAAALNLINLDVGTFAGLPTESISSRCWYCWMNFSGCTTDSRCRNRPEHRNCLNGPQNRSAVKSISASGVPDCRAVRQRWRGRSGNL